MRASNVRSREVIQPIVPNGRQVRDCVVALKPAARGAAQRIN
jgi:hypothetical protein